jgi:hypothetical protein
MDAERPSDWAGPVLELPAGPQRPNPSRIYDYWLGGKDNFGVDRELAELVEKVAPWVVANVRANRSFVLDSVDGLARAGVDQFIDVGSGLPADVNVHEVARAVNPRAQVVYIDHDPVVITHARAWLESDDGALVLPGDARRPRPIIEDLKAGGRLDFGRPVAVLFAAVLHYLLDDDDPAATVAAFREVMAPGSFVLITHVVSDSDGRVEGTRAAVKSYAEAAIPCAARSTREVADLFTGFEVVPPELQLLRHRGEVTTMLGGKGRLEA